MTKHLDSVVHRFIEAIQRVPADCDVAFRAVCLRDKQLRSLPARRKTAR